MLIKLNGFPWDSVKTPTPSFDPVTVYIELTKTAVSQIHGNFDAAHIHRAIYVEHLDQINYWIMSKTAITDHAYKAACWGVDHVLTLVSGGGPL